MARKALTLLGFTFIGLYCLIQWSGVTEQAKAETILKSQGYENVKFLGHRFQPSTEFDNFPIVFQNEDGQTGTVRTSCTWKGYEVQLD